MNEGPYKPKRKPEEYLEFLNNAADFEYDAYGLRLSSRDWRSFSGDCIEECIDRALDIKINPCSQCGETPELEEVFATIRGDDDYYRLLCTYCWEGNDESQFYAWDYVEEECLNKWNEQNPVKKLTEWKSLTMEQITEDAEYLTKKLHGG